MESFKIKVIEVCSSVLDPLVQNIRERTNNPGELNIPVTIHMWYTVYRDNLKHCIDTSLTVNGTLTKTAADLLLGKENIDTGAAVCLAAILSGRFDYLKGKMVIIPIFGKIERLQENQLSKKSKFEEWLVLLFFRCIFIFQNVSLTKRNL